MRPLTDAEILKALRDSPEPRAYLDIYTDDHYPAVAIQKWLTTWEDKFELSYDADKGLLLINCDRAIFEDVWHILKEHGVGIIRIV